MNDQDFINKHKYINWISISRDEDISEDFIRRHVDNICWTLLKKEFSEEFIEEFIDKLYIEGIVKKQKLSENFWKKHLYNNYVKLSYVFKYQNLSEEFVEYIISAPESQNRIQELWNIISAYMRLSVSFFKKYQDLINWECVACRCDLTEDFIEEFMEKFAAIFGKVATSNIVKRNALSESFLRKHVDKFDLYYLAAYQNLSESFIKDFYKKDKLGECWKGICMNNKLSESFMEECEKYIIWDTVSYCQEISEKFYLKHKNKLNAENIVKYQKFSIEFLKKQGLEQFLPNKTNNWLYWSKEEKLEFIKPRNRDAYEIVNDEYIVAYMAVDVNNYSPYKFHTKYLVGQEYKSMCDCDYRYSSLGLTVYGKPIAATNVIGVNFNNRSRAFIPDDYKILKVHVNIEDIGCFDHNGAIRAKKIKVVSEEYCKG